MNDRLLEIILERLEKDQVREEVAKLVLAAFRGQPELQRLLVGSQTGKEVEEHLSDQPDQERGCFISSITVQGFRGIGPTSTLELAPGPSLTIVVGRNGSGKSSFAEALEMLVTGDNRRWSARSKTWKEGWKNLHHAGPPSINAEFVMVDVEGFVTATREWEDDSQLESSRAWVQRPGSRKDDFSSLGWEGSIRTFRPFLSYNELGSTLDEGPTKLYDAMSSILGLGDLVETASRLGVERLSLQREKKDTNKELGPLLDKLSELADSRASRCLEALKGRDWDLGVVKSIVTGDTEVGETDDIQVLRRLCTIEPPKPQKVADAVSKLKEAAAEQDKIRDTNLQKDQNLADLLNRALNIHEAHGDMECPVCWVGRLDSNWQEKARREVAKLSERSNRANLADQKARRAVEEARALAMQPPAELLRAKKMGLDPEPSEKAFQEWAQRLKSEKNPLVLAHVIEESLPNLESVLGGLRDDSKALLESLQMAWRPIAAELASWIQRAGRVRRDEDKLSLVKAAEDWIKRAQADIRDQRFDPISTKASEVWRMLRCQSNVDLGRIKLEGAASRRRVTLDVTVDGVPGIALGVMSQGELHCLALSLFLPRATLDESPFRFVVIDDPVQSMDPARVDGLARVLEECSKNRQIIVFTHDTRLDTAIRHLQIDATIVEVDRGTGSVVTTRKSLDPVRRHFNDAMALVQTENLPERVARKVVPGLCRLGLEAACIEALRRRWLGRGESHSSIEEVLEKAQTLKARVALALLVEQGEVLSRLRKIGGWSVDAYQSCQKGAHGHFEKDLVLLVRDCERLAKKLRRAE